MLQFNLISTHILILVAKQIFSSRDGCRGDFSRKRSEVASISDGDSSSWLQESPTTGHSWANQASWWHLCDNFFEYLKTIFRGKKTCTAEGDEWEYPREITPQTLWAEQKEWKKVLHVLEQGFSWSLWRVSLMQVVPHSSQRSMVEQRSDSQPKLNYCTLHIYLSSQIFRYSEDIVCKQ